MADEAVDENKPARTEINLSISLGDNVRIKGQGISGRLSGDVTMVSSENGELIGNGEIRIVDGKYSAYGQSLEIQEGRVIFSNYPMDNPELRIRAIRRINSDITAGLTVTGFFSNPQVSLISTPSMADEEILSYIVFGLFDLRGGNKPDWGGNRPGCQKQRINHPESFLHVRPGPAGTDF
jgi:translocation and assembly module TamB